ncbi:MAG: hypothetical protein ACYTFG_00210 [Planctomycetota bacterium]
MIFLYADHRRGRYHRLSRSGTYSPTSNLGILTNAGSESGAPVVIPQDYGRERYLGSKSGVLCCGYYVSELEMSGASSRKGRPMGFSKSSLL